MQLEVLEGEKPVRCARIGPVFVFICSGVLNETNAANLPPFVAHVANQAPKGMAILNIVERSAKPPNNGARKIMARVLEDHRDHIACTAVVVEGSGFQPAMVRSIATGLAMIANTPFPYEVRTLGKSMDFFARHLGAADVDFSAPAFSQALTTFRGETCADPPSE